MKFDLKIELTIKCFLHIIILANDKCDSALGILDAGELVDVGLPLKQGVDSLWMAIVRGIVEWSPLSVIQCHDICLLLKKKFDASKTALSASQVKW